MRKRVNAEIRNIKPEYWKRFSSEMEHDSLRWAEENLGNAKEKIGIRE